MRAHTTNAAWQLRSEHEVGALAPGLCADFTVRDVNPRTAVAEELAEELAEARVLATAVDGGLE